MDRKTIAPVFVEDAVEALRHRGIDAGPILLSVGLPAQVVSPVSARQYGRMWLAMAEAADDEFFGLGARPMRPGSFALLCYAVLHAGTLERALRRALRFLRIVLDDPGGDLELREGLATIVLTDRNGPRSAFAYRTFWLILHGIACWLVGRQLPLRQVDFASPPPERENDHRMFFGAPVRFNQPNSLITFDASLLSLPIVRSEQQLRHFLRDAPANILIRYRHEVGRTALIRAQLRASPVSEWPDFDTMAHRMKLSPASLRRSLRAEGQSYQVIKDELRAAIARSLLRESSLTVAEIAVEVGFAEPSAFYRAFRSWTGMSPGDLRNSSGNMEG